MPPAQKYHIDTLADQVVSCRKQVGSCEFGGLDTHFYDEDAAYQKLRLWRELNSAWLAASAYPQEKDWVTEYIFDPSRPESYKNYLVFLGMDIPTGTRIVLENGWMFTKESFDDFWIMDSGYERVGGIKNGQVLKYYEFLKQLQEFGGRLEYTEGIEPIARLRWKELREAPIEEHQAAPVLPEVPAPTGILAKLKRSLRG